MFYSSRDAICQLTNTEVTNANTGDETTHHHVDPRLHRGDLDDVSNDEKEDTKCQTLAATPPVGCVGAGKSTQEGTDAHEGDEDGRPGCGDGIACCCTRVLDTETTEEVFEDEHATDLTLLRLIVSAWDLSVVSIRRTVS